MVWRRLVAPGLGELQLLLLCRSRRVSRGAGCCFSLNGNSALAGDFLVGYPALCLWVALSTLICSGSLPNSFASVSSHSEHLFLFLGGWGLKGHACQWAQWPILINSYNVGASPGTPSSQWVIQHARLPRVTSDGQLPAEPRSCWAQKGPGSGSPHHRTCWASGGSACCIRVFPKRSRSSRPLLVGGGACAGGRQSMLGAWAGGGTEGSVPSDDCGQRRRV